MKTTIKLLVKIKLDCDTLEGLTEAKKELKFDMRTFGGSSVGGKNGDWDYHVYKIEEVEE